MKKFKTLLFIILIISSITKLFAEPIEKITIEGNSRVITEYIENLLSSTISEEYSEELLNHDLRTLYQTDLFSSVNGSFNNGILNIIVVENPLINNVIFSGNSKLKEDVLQQEVLSESRGTFSNTKVELDIKRITDLYYTSGYFEATVSYELIERDFNRVDITFYIKEGDKTTISDILFLGNNYFSSGELESNLITKSDKWWRFFNSTDIYDANRIAYDGEVLRQFYFENGFPNFSVVSNFSKLTPDRGIKVTYVIDEGERYKFGDVTLSIKLLDLLPYEQDIKDVINIFDESDWFKNSSIEQQKLRIKDTINDLGYQFVDINHQLVFNDVLRQVDVVFVVEQQNSVFVNQVNIQGNKRTRDYVIRRELKFSEQDAFDPDSISRAQRNLYRTGYFSSVQISDSPDRVPGKVNLNVDVEEVSTGSISVGGGFSTVDKLTFEAAYSESNLFGTGNKLSATFNLSSSNKLYNLSLSNPYFLGQELHATTSLYRSDSRASDFSDVSLYQKLEQGISNSIAYQLSNNVTQSLGYRLFYRNIYDVKPGVSRSIAELEGTAIVSILSHNLIYNTTDNPLFITEGVNLRLGTEYAGLFGDIDYIKNTLTTAWYYSIFEEVVFSAVGSVGMIEGLREQEVKLVDKFNLGGPTLRGFKIGANYGGVGPIDLTTSESIGGKYMFRGSFQIETPFPGAEQYGLLVYTFSDFGTVTDFSDDPEIYDSASIRISAGVGLSWRSPIGIINLNLGIPIRKEQQDATEVIFLDFGTRF